MSKSVFFAVSFLALIVINASAPISCPSARDLDPCICRRYAYGLHIICANFNDNSDLIKAFKVLRDYQVQNVLLHGLYLTEVLPDDLFDGLEISELRVEKSKLKFSEPAFTGLDESLSILNVAQQSRIKSSEGFSLARLTKLTELNIKSNHLIKIKNQWLNDKIPNVHTLVLEENEISEIESDAFAKLPELKSISLAGNRIQKVLRSMFPRPATALTKIDLCDNEIKSLPFDFFFDMPSLTEVLLSGNDLQTLPERTWISVWDQLEKVVLLNNRFVCDEKLDWLKNERWPNQCQVYCTLPSKYNDKSLKEIYKT